MLRLAGPAVAIALALTAPAVASAPQELSAGTPAPDSESRFDAVPEFSFTDRSGAEVTRTDLAGQPWIGVPFFVRCTGPCPSITRDIAENGIANLLCSSQHFLAGLHPKHPLFKPDEEWLSSHVFDQHSSANGHAWSEFLRLYEPVMYRVARAQGWCFRHHSQASFMHTNPKTK